MSFQPIRQAPPPPHCQLFGGTSSLLRKNSFSKSSQPGTSLQVHKLSNMLQQEYTSLIKEHKRNLPDPRDGFIDVEGHPKLTVRYGQVEFKTADHGKVPGLPVNEKVKTPKMEAKFLSNKNDH